jgi:hypothetical protein
VVEKTTVLVPWNEDTTNLLSMVMLCARASQQRARVCVHRAVRDVVAGREAGMQNASVQLRARSATVSSRQLSPFGTSAIPQSASKQ